MHPTVVGKQEVNDQPVYSSITTEKHQCEEGRSTLVKHGNCWEKENPYKQNEVLVKGKMNIVSMIIRFTH